MTELSEHDWAATGIPGQHHNLWRDAGFNASEAVDWCEVYRVAHGSAANAGWEPNLASEFRGLDFDAAEALLWAAAYGDSSGPPSIAAWRAAGFEPADAQSWWVSWQDAGMSPLAAGDATAWVAVGVDPQSAVKYELAGLAPSQVETLGRLAADALVVSVDGGQSG